MLAFGEHKKDCNIAATSKLSPVSAFNLGNTNLLLPKDKILDWSKFKAFAEDKINVTEKLKFALGRVENIVGKGENAGYQHFLLFLECFQKACYTGSMKVVTV